MQVKAQRKAVELADSTSKAAGLAKTTRKATKDAKKAEAERKAVN